MSQIRYWSDEKLIVDQVIFLKKTIEKQCAILSDKLPSDAKYHAACHEAFNRGQTI